MAKRKVETIHLLKIVESIKAQNVAISLAFSRLEGLATRLDLEQHHGKETNRKEVADSIRRAIAEARAACWPESET